MELVEEVGSVNQVIQTVGKINSLNGIINSETLAAYTPNTSTNQF